MWPGVLVCGFSMLVQATSTPSVSNDTTHLPLLDRPPVFEDFLDTRPDGEVERRMARVSDFVQWRPREGEPGSEQTVAYLGHDAERIYVVFVAFDRRPAAVRARLTPRDAMYGDDRVFVWFDTFADRRQSVAFGVNPRNVQGDFIWTDPDGFESAYDAVYESRTALIEDGWVAWLAIPFRSLRFPRTDEQRWGIFLERTMSGRDESVFWPRLSTAIEGRLRQFGSLTGLRGVSPGGALQVTPYVAARSIDATPSARDTRTRLGADVKMVVRDSLVLDATVRPDFSQVDSDEPQLVANERFEVVHPERRPFFLENAALFGNTAGADRLRLFFSRRIVEPDAGARITGRLGDWTLAGLAVADRDPTADTSATSFNTVAAIRRDLGGRSDVGVFVSSRSTSAVRHHLVSTEGRLTFTRNWSLAALGAVSRTGAGGTMANGAATALDLVREGSSLLVRTRAHDVSSAFRSELGYVPRTGIRTVEQTVRWWWRPGGRVVSHGPTVHAERLWDHRGRALDWTILAGYDVSVAGPVDAAVTRRERLETYLDRPLRVGTTDVTISTSRLSWVSGTASASWGTDVNHAPAEAIGAAIGRTRALSATATAHIGTRVRLEQLLRMSSLTAIGAPEQQLRDRVLRTTLAWQATPRLTLRGIADHQSVLADSSWSTARAGRWTAWDLLASYRVRPGTALHVGWARNAWDEDTATTPRSGNARDPRVRALFVKISYLIAP